MDILLIDDDTLDRMNIVRTLNKADPSILIVEASESKDGLSLASETLFDLILLDYQLPDLNGLEVLQQLQNTKNINTAVIMLSHSDDDELALKCIQNGAQDFIKKGEVSVSRLSRAIYHAQIRSQTEKELRESHEELRKIAQIDSLTGLANRYAFDKSVRKTIFLAKRQRHSIALIMMDLDKFKNVNDTLGHVAGDTLLREVANRLTKVVREEEMFCRLGGDEFAILVPCYLGANEVKRLINRISHALEKPFTLENTPFVISASIGAATFPDCADNAEDLLKCADIAMYRSKELGRNQAQFYSQSMHDEVSRRIQLELDLHNALKNEEFILYYQPQISCADSLLITLDALIYWQHPTQGLISPSNFLCIAEEMGIISDIEQWSIEATFIQIKKWMLQSNDSHFPYPVAINLSAAQLSQENYSKSLFTLLDEYGITANNLEISITSHAIMNSSYAETVMNDLVNLGIPLAIDNFGSEHSSISQLQKFPFSILKIDKSFVHTLNEGDHEFLNAINSFAKTLGFIVVAKGIDDEYQEKYCKSLKLDRMQGEKIDKPLSASEFQSRWLQPK
jgi:diguanylate cyclase (GGDEF)-like protein